MLSQVSAFVKGHPLVVFFVLAYVVSWAGWLVTVAFGVPVGFLPFGPLLAVLVVIAITGGWPGLRGLGARMIRWRVGWQWYVAAIGLPLAVLVAAVVLNVAFGAPAPSFAALGSLSSIALVFAVRLIDPTDGPMGEEPGWRGLALPALLTGRSPLMGTLILGALVAGWHIPLVFVGGMQPIDLLGPIAFAVVCTWLFKHTGGSVLLTIVMHAAEGTIHPVALWSAGDATRVGWIYPLMWCVAALAVVILDWRTWRTGEPLSAAPRGHGVLRTWLARGAAALTLLLFVPAATGLMYQAVAAERDRILYPPPGQMVVVAGQSFHIHCTGQGSPTVILETGLGAWSSSWALIQPAIDNTTRVCSYDRAGLGWSERGPAPRDARRIATELYTLLQQADVPGPYVLAGHSNGTLYARMFADLYPREVVGMVLADNTPPDLFERLPATRANFANASQQARTFAMLAPFGTLRLVMPGALQAELAAFPKSDTDAIIALNSTGLEWQGMEAEVAALVASMAEVSQVGGLGDRPLVVLSSTVAPGTPDDAATKLELDRELAAVSTNSQHVVVEGATHLGLASNPEHARVTSAAILRVVAAVRTSTSLRAAEATFATAQSPSPAAPR